MTIDQAKQFLVQLNAVAYFSCKLEWSDEYEVTSSYDGKGLPNSNRNGVYLYVVNNEIVYIGKGECAGGNGIGNRACSAHLGARNKNDGVMFPYHQWTRDDEVALELQAVISEGRFSIYTVAVLPDWCSSLIEMLLLSEAQRLNDRLPVLNKKIG